MRGERQAVVWSAAQIYSENLFAWLAIFCVEKFDFVRVPIGELESQSASCAVETRLVGRFCMDSRPALIVIGQAGIEFQPGCSVLLDIAERHQLAHISQVIPAEASEGGQLWHIIRSEERR